MIVSIFFSIFLYFDVLVVFNKEDIDRLKNNKLNDNKESEVQYKNKCRFFKKKIVKKKCKNEEILNCNSDQDIIPISKDACVKENNINEDQSFEELKKWIAKEIKGNKILKNDDNEVLDVE